MSQPNVSQPEAVADSSKPVATSETSQPREASVRNIAPQPEVAPSYKTLQLLKELPVVLYIWNKGQETYNSVKHSTKIAEAGLNISEKVVATITAKLGSVMQKLTPVLKVVDYSASEGLELLQKFFPIVKESPEKIYDSVVGRVVKLIGPAVNTAVSITEIGRKQLKRTTKSVIRSSRKVFTLVENRLEGLENYLAAKEDETAAEPPTEGATSQGEPVQSSAAASSWSGKLVSCARTSLAVSAKTSLFVVGASFWLLESLPLVGKYFSEAADSPPRSTQPSTSTSSYHSVAEEQEGEQEQQQEQGPASQLPPQLAQATN